MPNGSVIRVERTRSNPPPALCPVPDIEHPREWLRVRPPRPPGDIRQASVLGWGLVDFHRLIWRSDSRQCTGSA